MFKGGGLLDMQESSLQSLPFAIKAVTRQEKTCTLQTVHRFLLEGCSVCPSWCSCKPMHEHARKDIVAALVSEAKRDQRQDGAKKEPDNAAHYK